MKNSKPISPQKVLVYSLERLSFHARWNTSSLVEYHFFSSFHVVCARVHESDQCTMGPVFSVFLFSFLVAQQRQGLSGAHVSRHPLVGRYGVGVCVRHLLCQW